MNLSVGRNDPCPCGSGLKYKKCCLKNPEVHENEETLELLATAYKKLSEREWETALALFEKALPHAKVPNTVLEAIAACFDGMDDYWNASAAYERALEKCPNTGRAMLMYRYAVAKARCKQWNEACDAFREFQKLETRGQLSDRVDKVIDTIHRIQEGKLHENTFEVNIQLSRALAAMDEERFTDAVKRLERARALEPENPTIYFNLGVAYTFVKDEDKALETFQTCVDISPSAAEAYYDMGQIYLLRKRDFSKALSCFSRAAAVKPDYIGAHHQKGKAYELLGYPEKALECWQKTIQLDPDNKLARENIKRVKDLMNRAKIAESSNKEEYSENKT